VDYKESERLPGELSCALEVLADEAAIVHLNNKSPAATAMLAHVKDILDIMLSWFNKGERTGTLLIKISELNAHFLAFEPLTQANVIARLKQEQSNIRRLVTRIHTIRETSFNPSAYAIAETMSAILSVGLIFTRIEPYYESLFFISFVSFVLIYMVLLIKDLDNPFGYYERGALTENVSLKPLLDLRSRLSAVPPEAHEGPKREVAPHLGERVAAGRKGKRRR
jgi:hypothetical protein